MTVARNPLHRSGRAALPHPAPASGDNAKSPQGIRVSDARRWEPALNEPPHPLPGEPGSLAAPPQGAVPEPPYLGTEREQRRPVHWHPVILQVPDDDRSQPRPHFGDRPVQASPQLGFHLAQLRLQPLPDRLPDHREPPVPLLPADVHEADEVERLRLPLVGAPSVLGREWPELQQPRLLGVQLQAELRQPLAELGQEPLGLLPVLKPDDEVIRVPHDDHVAVGLRLPPSPNPEVERVVQVHVGQERRDAAPLGRALVAPRPRSVLPHARVEPFLDQPHDAPVRNPLQPSGPVREVVLEGLPVGPPPLTVDPGRGVSLQRVVRPPQVLDVVDVVQERREPHLLVPLSSFTYPGPRTQRAVPAQCPGRVLLARVPFGQAPSLHPLRRRSLSVVRELRRYYGPVRLPVVVHHRRTSLDFPIRPAAPSATGNHGLSRFSREVCPSMHGVCDRAGLRGVLRWRRPGCGLPPTPTASASRREALSRLNTRPARTPVNASRTAAHDSGPVWVARPSPYDSLLRNTSPVYPGAQASRHYGADHRTHRTHGPRHLRSSPAVP